MIGFNLSEGGHLVNALPPQNISGGKTAQAFSMAGYKHASIVVLLGALAGEGATLLLYVCSSAAGANPVAIPFNYYFQAAAGAGNDVLSALNSATAAGLAFAAGVTPANGAVVIEIDANELEAAGVYLGQDAYLQVKLNDAAEADYAAVAVILSGARNANVGSGSVTV